MEPLDTIFHRRGGLVSTTELQRDGLTTVLIDIYERYGALVRARQGWYMPPGTSETQRMAWQVGGRLTCVSALAHHGLVAMPRQTHVVLPRYVARSRLRPELLTGLVLHWRRVAPPGDRHAVSADEAAAQALRCQALDADERRAVAHLAGDTL